MKKNTVIIAAVVALIVGAGAGFFGGMTYQKSKTSTAADNRAGGQGRRFGQGAGGQNGMRPVTGEILSIDDKSMTIKMQDGTSKIVLLSATTMISQTTPGAKTDLATGKQVLVIGMTNSDGSVSAQNVQLNPQFRGGMGGSPRPSATPSY